MIPSTYYTCFTKTFGFVQKKKKERKEKLYLTANYLTAHAASSSGKYLNKNHISNSC